MGKNNVKRSLSYGDGEKETETERGREGGEGKKGRIRQSMPEIARKPVKLGLLLILLNRIDYN